MTPSQLARFEAKVHVEPNTGCWLWTGSTSKAGYGDLWVGSRHVLAHRLSYELHRGEIPSGLVLDHLCRTPACVNPAHLEAVTQRENVMRGEGSDNPGSFHRSKTHCPRGHEYNEANTIHEKKGRSCRPCKLYHQRLRRAKEKAHANEQ